VDERRGDDPAFTRDWHGGWGKQDRSAKSAMGISFRARVMKKYIFTPSRLLCF